MKFRRKWLKWTKVYVCSSSFSILNNGNPTIGFQARKGLRQWDPFSPFLFILAAKGISGLLWNVC